MPLLLPNNSETEVQPMADDHEEAGRQWYDRKSALMEDVLGKEHDMVMHAIIPYALGGGLDLYFYPHGVPGTAIATKELSELPGEGSSNSVYACYELVMFTKCPLELDAAQDEGKAFGRSHSAINAILNRIAPYSALATLNPYETCEFPAEMPTVGGRCLVFDGYTPHADDEPAEFGLLLIIEVFRSEMAFAQQNGAAEAFKF